MSTRSLIAVVLCLTFLAARAVGLHSHISDADSEATAPAAHHADDHHHHPERITTLQAEGSAGHLDAHLHDGDVDLDSSAVSLAKQPLPKMALELLAVLCVLAIGPAVVTLVSRAPPRPPPEIIRRFFLLPPPHAPPSLA